MGLHVSVLKHGSASTSQPTRVSNKLVLLPWQPNSYKTFTDLYYT